MHPDPVTRPSGRTLRAIEADRKALDRDGRRYGGALVLVVILTALAIAASGCCVTGTEHKAFVEASRAYYESVGSDGALHNARCLDLNPISRVNRASAHEDYRKALEAAEARTR